LQIIVAFVHQSFRRRHPPLQPLHLRAAHA
jgi:hypothetical protein